MGEAEEEGEEDMQEGYGSFSHPCFNHLIFKILAFLVKILLETMF